MRQGVHLESGNIQWGASLALHVAIGLMLMLLPQVRPLPLPVEDSVSVDVLTPNQFEAATKPALVEEAKEPAAVLSPSQLLERKELETSKPAEAETPPAAGPRAMIRATEFLSAGALADPRSRKAREELKTLASGDRIIQLCNIEAMEQVHRWKPELRPDSVVAYATASVRLSEYAVEAKGGAFRSKRQWYNIRFRCEVAADREKIAAFEFLVGEEIPKDEWAEYGLFTGEAQD